MLKYMVLKGYCSTANWISQYIVFVSVYKVNCHTWKYVSIV